MTLAGARELVADAVARGGAVPAFNAIGLEHAESIVAGAESAGAGVLIQLSRNAIRYRGALEPLAAACHELAAAAAVPVGIHADHIDDGALARRIIERGADLGIRSIMVDASARDYAGNVAETAGLAAAARAAGMWVEAELGAIGGKDGAHAPGVRTDPDEARAFVAATAVDGLAVAVGSSHAMRERSAHLDVDLVARLADAVPVPLVLHGSSGVGDEELRRAVAAGIRKVNVGTALLVAGAAALRASLAADPGAVDPRRYGAAARAATTELVARLSEVIAG